MALNIVREGQAMTDKHDTPAVIDFAEARRQRIHDIHDARLEAMRDAFSRALPLPSGKAGGKKRKKGKKSR
ncbi:hypothetical protein SAMN05216586_11149 [Halopseudomonas aestusnigri]|jgi:hypothetical protein|uniref:Uncharacterized protein n=2 Tax=Pseudomonadaceae TaxID=135621 RepID=A0AAQ1G9G0_9GAMM|nr:hypothetical protein MFKK_34130 [Halopseudomonas aestusnigri]GMQ53610.1 hypothetical protein YSKK_14730 [Halopseudomonas aestusnigri]SEG60370.1 hypothetical protein SAMN05216586_11149 [Halopseudomonas aestusnigri]|tara:strand:+ start:3336 stop:3548 length:213 start_codon:yes stop_codon:yes gene_type:complete